MTPFVFVIMPFAPEWNDHYELGVKPACEAAGATCARVDEQIFLERILDRIYAQIEAADLIVAEMTSQNPNVFYETGYAHGIEKPIILLTRTVDSIPFDLRQHPHVVYGNSIHQLRSELERRVRWFLEHPEDVQASVRRSSAESQELERMAAQVVSYLNAHGFTMVSFERVRTLYPRYSDEQLAHLIDTSPSQFRAVRLKGGRPGIGLV